MRTLLVRPDDDCGKAGAGSEVEVGGARGEGAVGGDKELVGGGEAAVGGVEKEG